MITNNLMTQRVTTEKLKLTRCFILRYHASSRDYQLYVLIKDLQRHYLQKQVLFPRKIARNEWPTRPVDWDCSIAHSGKKLSALNTIGSKTTTHYSNKLQMKDAPKFTIRIEEPCLIAWMERATATEVAISLQTQRTQRINKPRNSTNHQTILLPSLAFVAFIKWLIVSRHSLR